MVGEDFQVDRIIKQLLMIEDHFNAVLEEGKYQLFCIECLNEKHLPLTEGLCIECIDGVCKIDRTKEVCEEILKTIEEIKEKIYNQITKDDFKNFAERIRKLRKELQELQKQAKPVEIE